MAHTRNPSTALRRFSRSIIGTLSLCAVLLVLLNFTGCMERLFYHPQAGATPVPVKFPGGRLIYFHSADGTRLAGWFLPSEHPSYPPATAPTILHVHGNAGNLAGHVWFTEYLPAAGFNLFLFDYRGYGESEGNAVRRKDLIADTHAAVDYLLSRPDVNHAAIGMYGQSLGGSIGLLVMARRAEIRAAVIESAFTSWRDVAANAVGGASPGWLARAVALLIPAGERPIDAMAEINRPVLILHGTDDSIVPVTHGRALARAGGKTITLHEFRGGEHNSLRESNPEIETLVSGFFHDHLHAEFQRVEARP